MPSTIRSVVVCLALLLSATAAAQTPPTPPTPPSNSGDAHESDDAAARLLYERGAEALQNGEYQTALDRFQQAYDLSHRPQLLYNIGTTLDRLRRDREALAAFEQFLREVPEHPRRPEVEARARALTTAIAEQDRLAAEAEARAREDRERIEAARAEAERQAEQARLDREAAERRAAEASDGLPPAVMISVGGAAVVAGGLGVLFGLRTTSLNDDYRQAAAAAFDLSGGNVTSQQYADIRAMRDDAQSAQRVTNICLFSSAALAAGAVTLIFFTDWGGDETAAAQAARRPMPILSFGPGGGYAGISRRF